MGNAKRRGTFEERKAGAIVRQKVEAERKATRRVEIEASKTPKLKLEEHQAMMRLMTMLGMAGAYGTKYLK